MKLLLTNDDGVAAPGLRALQRAASAFGKAVIVAPHTPLSGCSHQTTTQRPLSIDELAPGTYAIDGTPADCVRLGLLHLANDVDWVLSGINDGANLGVDVYMSGTVAAAREAALFGKFAAAFSHYRSGRQAIDWERAAQCTVRVLRGLTVEAPEDRTYWNVNLPDLPGEAPPPHIVRCPLDPNPLPVTFQQQDGTFQYSGDYHARRRHPRSDVDVCFAGSVAVSLIRL